MAALEVDAAPQVLGTDAVVLSAVRMALERGDRIDAVQRYAAYARACTRDGRPQHPELAALFRRALREGEPDERAVLPATPFFARDEKLNEVLGLVRAGVPAIVLHGPGGVGKTRLALAVLEASRDLAGEVRWCSLGDATGDAGARLEALCEGVAFDATALFVIDHAECHADAVRAMRRLVRRAAARWTFVLTTRFAGIEEDAVLVRIEPFAASAGVAFLRARARAAGVPVGEDAATSRVLAAIVARVDGLPLALEIVAAQLRTFSLVEALARLGATGIGERFAELAVTSSVAALDPTARAAFARIGAFNGRWSLDDVRSALDGAPSEAEVAAVVERLVAWSLVNVDRSGPVTTYELLATTRGVAHAELERSGQGVAVFTRIERAALERATALGEASLRGDATALDRIAASLSVILTGIERAAETHGREEAAAAAFVSLERFWLDRGHAREALAVFDRSIRASDGGRNARLAITEASCARRLGDTRRATAAIERAVELAKRAADPALLGRALRTAGAIAFERGDGEAAAGALERSIALEKPGSLAWGRTLANLAVLYASNGQDDAALDVYDRIEEACDDEHLALTGAVGRATCYADKGDVAAAHAWIGRAHAMLGDRPAPHDIAIVTHGETLAATLLGDGAWALRGARAALSVAMVHDLRIFVTLVTGLVAIAAAAACEAADVATVYGFAEAARRRERMSAQPALEVALARATATLRARLGERAFASARRVGAATDAADVVALVFALDDRMAVESPAPLRVSAPVAIRLASGTIEREGTTIVLAPRERDLVAALVAVDRRVSREALLDALWPDQSRQNAGNALRVTLHRLRAKLGPGRAIERIGDGFRLDPRVAAVDLALVERALRRRDEVDAPELAAFVDDVRRSSGLPPGERPWTGAIERRIERAAASAALRVAEIALSRGETARALDYANWLCAIDPLDEEGTVLAVRAWRAIGDFGTARRTGDAYVARLREELDAEPGDALRALFA